MSASFEEVYGKIVQLIVGQGTNEERSPELEPLLRRFYEEAVRNPAKLYALKIALVNLLRFLATPSGQTNVNCRTVDLFVCLGEWTYPDDLPEPFSDIIADMGGALHDTVIAPEIAHNFESTPEQLLEKALKLET